MAEAHPRDFHYEFGGPVGAGFLVVFLPSVAYGLYAICGPEGCPAVNSHVTRSIDLNAAAVYVVWFLFQVLLYYIVPGTYEKGVVLKNGKRLEYKINAHTIFWLSLLTLFAGQHYGYIRLSWIYDNFESLILTSFIFSFFLAVFVYISAKINNEQLAEGGNSGVIIYDFWMGHALNPRIGNFDLKYFCELRPGLIGWVVINIGMAYKQYEMSGEVDNSLIMVCLFHFFYVWDALYNEAAVLTTMDITTDGFGFMLAFGDLAWVPFTYTLQARYLVDFPLKLSRPAVAAILIVYGIGLYIFRSSNSQKDTFRKNPNDPSVAKLKTLTTERGTKLIVSGWWGTARHINYFGDWLMGLAYCLPCGFDSVIPYFYAIYFACLLIHREFRDEHACQQKYGKDWEKYCKIVKYRIIPYVF